jgi:tetratricopeptide (TPR) repeat protein
MLLASFYLVWPLVGETLPLTVMAQDAGNQEGGSKKKSKRARRNDPDPNADPILVIEDQQSAVAKNANVEPPHPLVRQIEVALDNNLLISPAGKSAYDLYQILSKTFPLESSLKTLKERVANTLTNYGAVPVSLYLQGTARSFNREDWAEARDYIVRAREIRNDKKSEIDKRAQKQLETLDLFYQGMVMLADRQPLPAEELFRQALKLDNQAPYLHNALGRALSDQKRDEEALGAYSRASALAPQWTYPLVNLAVKALRRGDLTTARDNARMAISIDLSDAEAHAVLAAASASLGNTEEALREYSLVIVQRPNSVVDRIAYGRLLLEQGDYALAENMLGIALQLAPTDSQAQLYFGIAIKKRAEYSIGFAEERLKNTVSINDWRYQIALAEAAEVRQDHTEAIAAYRTALQLEPWHVNVRLRLAAILITENRLPEAVDEYRLAVKQNPANRDAYNSLGVTLRRIGESKAAIVEYQRALTIDPTYLPARYNLAVALQDVGDLVGAATEYRAILTADPNNIAAANALKQLEPPENKK